MGDNFKCHIRGQRAAYLSLLTLRKDKNIPFPSAWLFCCIKSSLLHKLHYVRFLLQNLLVFLILLSPTNLQPLIV